MKNTSNNLLVVLSALATLGMLLAAMRKKSCH